MNLTHILIILIKIILIKISATVQALVSLATTFEEIAGITKKHGLLRILNGFIHFSI